MTTTDSEPKQKRWLTIEELESEYGFNRHTQSRMRHLKTIPFSKVGKQIRYDRELINEWLESKRVN